MLIGLLLWGIPLQSQLVLYEGKVVDLPGTLVGPLSIRFILTPGLNEALVDEYRVLIEEVNCITGLTEEILYDNTFSNGEFPAGGFAPNEYEVGPPGEEELGYFLKKSGLEGPSITDGRCYKVTIITSAECGDIERFSYFNLAQPGDDPGCPFCLDDGDGAYTFSSPGTADPVAVWPNPAADQLEIQLQQPEAGQHRIELLDISGATLRSLAHTVDMGSHRYSLDLSQLPSGVYLLRVQVNEAAQVKRIVKQ